MSDWPALERARQLQPQLEECITHADVLRVMTGETFETFRVLDEQPGAVDSEYGQHTWHRLLRQVRNDPGNDLFDRLTR